MSQPSSSQPNEDDGAYHCSIGLGKCRIPQRVILALMLHMFLQSSYNTRVVLNVAIVEMVQPTEEEQVAEVACPEYGTPNVTSEGGQFPWPVETKALVLYSFYIGYTLTQIPGGWIADKFGARWVILSTIIVSIIVTGLFPLVIKWGGYVAAVVLRFILGVAHGPCLPCVSSLVSTWFPPSERRLFGGISFGGSNLGTIMSNILSGYIIDAFNGWPAAFYFWTGYSAVYLLFAIFLLFSFPDTHPFITQREATYIKKETSSSRSLTKRDLRTPLRGILLNVPYWANIAAQFGHNYIYFSLVTYLPTYLRDILQFDVSSDGLFSAIPFFALWMMSLIVSSTAFIFTKYMSQRMFDIVFGAGNNVACAALLLGAVYVGCDRVLCITLYIMSMLVKAFYYSTLPINISVLSQNYGGVMFGLCNAIGSISGIIGNFIIGRFTQNKQLHEWKLVFWINMAIAVVTTIIFTLFSSHKRQEFDYEPGEPREP